jgi:hypothetical protein
MKPMVSEKDKEKTTIRFDSDVWQIIDDYKALNNVDSIKDAVQALIKKGALYSIQFRELENEQLVGYYCEEGHVQHLYEGNPNHISDLVCVQNPAHTCKFAKYLSDKNLGGCPLAHHKELRSLIAKYL